MRFLVLFLCLISAVQAQEVFGFQVLEIPLNTEVAAYRNKTVWLYGSVPLLCQRRDAPGILRGYSSHPENAFTVQGIVPIKLPDDFENSISIDGGAVHPLDKMGEVTKTAFLILLESASPLTNESFGYSGELGEPVYQPCQAFYTFALPNDDALERMFSLISPRQTATEFGWNKTELALVLADSARIEIGITREMVVWLKGWPLEPSSRAEAIQAETWDYRYLIPFSLTLHFEHGRVVSFSEGNLP